jgi:phenylpyruvate tautomerase PptA (4-oxalocrotonate tautomerase family)
LQGFCIVRAHVFVLFLLSNLSYQRYRLLGETRMPVVKVDLLEGYDAETKARLGRALTDAVLGVVAAAPEAVTVMLQDHAPEAYMRGGTHRSPGAPRPDPEEMVRRFLTTMEARDLDTARPCWRPDSP